MLSAVIGRVLNGNGSKACVLAHRDEITAQNVDKFLKVNPGWPVSLVDAGEKSWTGKATFAMVQTLSRETNLSQMPPIDLLVIDEAHHAEAMTYRRIVDRAKTLNPKVKIYGVTATPNRGDGKSLRRIFDNCADQITLAEMVALGQLVKPRTFVIDLGVSEALRNVRRVASEFDMDEVADIMDHSPITKEIIRHWKEKAGERRTVVFCSTIAHASHVTEAFISGGVSAELVTGETPEAEREGIFRRLDSGETQVLVNVAVATEGWDCPPISCVVLLRPCSHKSTMIQMIGRGLRKADPDNYPGLVKSDCLVLDFGTSALTHGTLEQEISFEDKESHPGMGPLKTCPECEAEVPIRTRECPFCGHEFPVGSTRGELEDFEMTEIDMLNRSSFQWCDVAGDGTALMASGFEAWGGVFNRDGLWVALGGVQKGPTKILHVGDRVSCLGSADDWMNLNESEETAHKSRRWLSQSPTDKQIQYLKSSAFENGRITRYKASCLLNLQFNRYRIKDVLAGLKAERAYAPAATR
jgi:superfamily II DNA or RNA helicase